MALSQNDIIIVNDFNELKSEIKTELDRRDQYTFSTWDNSANAIQNNIITDDIFNNLIKVLNIINEDTTNYDEVEVSKIIQQILSLKHYYLFLNNILLNLNVKSFLSFTTSDYQIFISSFYKMYVPKTM